MVISTGIIVLDIIIDKYCFCSKNFFLDLEYYRPQHIFQIMSLYPPFLSKL